MKRPTHIKKDLKSMTNAMVFAGISKNVAKALACIALSKEVLSKDIEVITGLRQPEVSLAVQELRRMGWAAKRDIKKAGKGRPIHAYRLSIPFSKIIDEIEARENAKLSKIKENLKALRGFVSSVSQEP
jgi:predicted transcriptional regulator